MKSIPPRFDSEPLMTEPVARHVTRLWPSMGSSHIVIEQIPGARGVIDLLVAEFDRGAITRRARRSVGPILRAEHIQILWALRDGRPHRLSTVAKLGGWSPSVIDRMLPTLEA